MHERIPINPKICHGKTCIAGTRVMVSVVLDNLAAGMTAEEIVRNYSTLQVADISAALAYAADVASERIVPMTQSTLKA